uniref:Hydroxymethylglutaryl-CoA lyase n=1 Tax=Pyramimonas obovata TaxID=1411642 RepID=A0A7S0R2L2_9CHLO|mmetsp:Transcript_24250/g.52907  ORF Transcript_24250/g.52907 Transcript_24250/m.52907 type:complete len:322 (+) Transcript_24250:93-1058(+)
MSALVRTTLTRLRVCTSVLGNRQLPSATNQITSRWLSTSTFTQNSRYYDSQSGRWMNVPGAAGIRIHDATLAGGITSSLPLEERFRLLETLIAAGPYSVELWEGAVEEIRRTRWTNEAPVNIVAKVDKPEQCEPELYRAAAQVALGVRCDDKDALASDLRQAREIIKEASDVGLQVRAYVLNAFEGEDGDDNLHHAAAHEAVLQLADQGADLIVLSDCRGLAHEDSLRELVEEAFYMDVVGDTMLERLGVRASLDNCRLAARFGVQHFDAGMSPPPAGAGQPVVPDPRGLLRVLEEEGKECSTDPRALDTLFAELAAQTKQ